MNHTHLRQRKAARINDGGVCDHCWLPRLAHPDGHCLTAAEAKPLYDRIDRWEAIVAPVREAYQAARVEAKRAGWRFRRGFATAEESEAAALRRDQLLVEYRAAIRRADREA